VVLALGAVESGAAATVSEGAAPSASEESSPAPPGSAQGSLAPGVAARVDDPQRGPASAASTTLRPGLFIWMLGDVGSLPSAGLGVGIGAHVDWSSWRVRAHASVLFEQHVSLELASAVDPGAELGLAVGGVAVCRRTAALQLWAATGALCLGAELGRLSGRGTNVVPARSGGALWAAPVLDGSLQAELGAGAALALTLGAALPLARNPFIIDEIGPVHRASSIAGRAALGLSWSFE
jgi:hypothetical protein